MPRHLALALTVALLAAACGTTTATPSSSPSAQACAWPIQETVATVNSDNGALPDAAASYGLQPAVCSLSTLAARGPAGCLPPA
jgi:hypothetical protein